MIKCALLAFLLLACLSLRAQLTPAAVVEKIYDAVDACNPCQYNTRMYFRTFGEDSFEIRDFTIRFRTAADNPAYGHDWEITEYHHEGFTSTMMHVGSEFYMIYKGPDQKCISQMHQSSPFEAGTFQWTMHDYFLLGNSIAPLKNVPEKDISLQDSAGYYILSCPTSPVSRREWIVPKSNPLPVQTKTIIHSTNFKFEQVQIVHFEYPIPDSTLPDSAFNPDFYIRAGYQYRNSGSDDEVETNTEYSISAINKVKLLEYPFIDADGDTFQLKNEFDTYALLDFWFASCTPCLESMPVINGIQNKYASQGLKVFGLNCMNIDTRQNVSAQLRKGNITFPLWYGQNTFLRQLGITMFPTYILIHPDGEMEYLNGGLRDIQKRLKTVFKTSKTRVKLKAAS